MQYKNIQELIDAGKVVELKLGIDYYKNQIEKLAESKGLAPDFYIVYVTNIFLNKKNNKYKNTRPLPCFIIKNMFGQKDGKDDYRLETLGNDIWEDYYRYSSLDMIDHILEHGYNYRIIGNDYKEKTQHKHIKIWETNKEANAYIKKFKKGNDLDKYIRQLADVNREIEQLTKEREQLEENIRLIKNESNT